MVLAILGYNPLLMVVLGRWVVVVSKCDILIPIIRVFWVYIQINNLYVWHFLSILTSNAYGGCQLQENGS